MSRGSQALQIVGIVAAVVLAGVANILAAHHFTRWDWTRDKRWSLSPATVETLHALSQPVEVWAITGPDDPIEQSLRGILVSYVAESSRVAVHWIDPDRDAVQLADLERRFDLEAGRSENGRAATDAVVVVASQQKHWFLTQSDLFETTDDARAKPHEERALTQGIRNVLGGDKAKLCFTVGHGELTLEPEGGDREALGTVRALLEKGNYELSSIDVTAPDAHEPFAGCSVVVIAGLRSPFAPAEANRLRTWLMEGGSLFAAVGPIEANTPTGMTSAGLDDVLAPFGIALDDQLVHDLDPPVAIPDTHGEGYFATPRPHPVTAPLVPGGPDAHPPRIAMFFSRSLRHASAPDGVWAAELLVSSNEAFAKANIVGAAGWADAPARQPSDAGGPFVVAMASERPAPSRVAAHGPRVVVVGSRFALLEDNWQQPRPLHGAAFFVDNSLSWLTARPSVVDIPERNEVSAGVRVSEEGRLEVRRYVLLFMPLAAVFLGIAVWAWRASSENKPYEPPGGKEFRR